MINYFTIDGESSADLGVFIGGQGSYDAPERDVTKYSIAGRNGDLTHDNGRFKNIALTYPVVILKDFDETVNDLTEWLLSKTGYCRLEDSYHPDYYREARVIDEIRFRTTAFNRTGVTRIKFDCKPQKWLKSGETAKSFTAKSGTITNPTRFTSKPLIRIYPVSTVSTFSLTIGNTTISVTGRTSDITYIDIDSETQNCYFGTRNLNNLVTLTKFPELVAGTNAFTATNTSRIEIKGRWWKV